MKPSSYVFHQQILLSNHKSIAMKRTLFLFIITFYLTGNLTAQSRVIENINSQWLFHKGDLKFATKQNIDEKAWDLVNIPHTWNADDSFDKRGIDDGFDIMYYYYRGPGWYRKWIKLEEEDANRRILLYFEAANAVAEVFVNDKLVGKHIGGYSGFQFDITDFVKFDSSNLISVKVDNSYNYDIPPHRADYTMYGGIYRDVLLVKTDKIFIDKLLIQTNDVSKSSGKIKLLTKLDNKSNYTDLKLRFTLIDPSGFELEKKDINILTQPKQIIKNEYDFTTVENPELWSPTNPKLYKVKTELLSNGKIVDELTQKFGFRFYRFDAKKGFFLNGNHLSLKGVNRHQDRAGYGWALTNDLHYEDMSIIKSMGANFVRMAHYQQDQAVLNACDELGLLVWEEIAVVTSVGHEKFKINAKNMLREMITEHYNHPSIIVWGLMNETDATPPPGDFNWNYELCLELNSMAKKLDPTRYTTQAQKGDDTTGISKITDISGWNRYFGWYYGAFEDFGKFMDEQKKLNPGQPTLISEYGAGSEKGYHKEIPDPSDFTEEWQIMFHRSALKQIVDRPWIAGACVWNMFSFASEEKQGSIKHINQKGLVTWDRKAKDVFYFYQSKWLDEAMIYIVSHTWLERSGANGEKKKIEVFSNCDKVELFNKGKNLGIKTSNFVWDVEFSEGKNALRAVGEKNSVKVTDEILINYTFD